MQPAPTKCLWKTQFFEKFFYGYPSVTSVLKSVSYTLMTRIRFDQFSKLFLEELLTPLGTVERNLEVPGEARFVDVWFIPSPQPPDTPRPLGLLGRIASTPCLLEPFRNPPAATEVRNCLLKLFLIQAQQQRQAKKQKVALLEAELPQLWILASSITQPQLTGLGAIAQPDWPTGVYHLPSLLRTAMIDISQLPVTRETLWLRLLGKGQTQEQAIAAVIALPPTDPERAMALRLLSTWKITIDTDHPEIIDSEEQRLTMALSQAFLEWEQATEYRGLQQGLQQGQRQVIEHLLRTRFGELDVQLQAIVPVILRLPPEDYTPLLLQLSRAELLDRFQAQ